MQPAPASRSVVLSPPPPPPPHSQSLLPRPGICQQILPPPPPPPPGSQHVSWLSGTNRHAPVPVPLYLSRSSESFPVAVAPISPAAALTAGAANGCVTHMSATTGRPGSSASTGHPARGHMGSAGGAAVQQDGLVQRVAGRAWTGGPEGPADMDSSAVAVALPAVAAGVATALTAVVASAVAAAAHASAGAAATREEPVSKNGSQLCNEWIAAQPHSWYDLPLHTLSVLHLLQCYPCTPSLQSLSTQPPPLNPPSSYRQGTRHTMYPYQ